MRVGNDLDGCYDNFGEGVRLSLVAKGYGHLWKSGDTPEPYWNFYEDWGWTLNQFKELVDWGVDTGIIFSGHWRPCALNTLRKFSESKHEIIFITDRAWGTDPKNSERNTLEAFEAADIHYDEFWFSKDKTVTHTDVFVEDKLDNYDALTANGTATFLINRAWNQVPGGDARNRIDCVCEFYDAVERIAQDGFADLSLV